MSLHCCIPASAPGAAKDRFALSPTARRRLDFPRHSQGREFRRSLNEIPGRAWLRSQPSRFFRRGRANRKLERAREPTRAAPFLRLGQNRGTLSFSFIFDPFQPCADRWHTSVLLRIPGSSSWQHLPSEKDAEMDAHCFSDSDTEYDMEIRSNSLEDDTNEETWAHPYEDMELITPSAKIELREFPVVDLAVEAEATSRRERKLNSLNSALSGGLVSATASATSVPGLTRIMGKGSWTIKVTPSGGVGRVVHRETGPDRRVILPNVDKEGTGNVMVGTLGGGGWEFAEVARLDKRATSVLWPNEKFNISVAKVSSKTLVASKLPQDLAEMTPEERLARERRDEKNRKERERRAQIKLDKLAKQQVELAQAAAAAAAAAAHGPAPCGPSAASAPTTPAPSTPPDSSDVGTPQTVVRNAGRQDLMEVESNAPAISSTGSTVAFPLDAGASNGQSAHAARQPHTHMPTVSATQTCVHTPALVGFSATQPATTPAVKATYLPASSNMVSSHGLSTTTTKTAYAGKKTPQLAQFTAMPQPFSAVGVVQAMLATATADSAMPPACLIPAAVSVLPGKVPAPTPVSTNGPSSMASLEPAKVVASRVPVSPRLSVPKSPPRSAPVSPRLAEVPKHDEKENVKDDEEQENMKDDEGKPELTHERGRADSKRRRLADLSPVEVNCRETDRMRPRGVQRA